MRLQIVFLTALVLFAVTPFQAQQNALFHATIRFEDAMGNKDSVIVGYDPDATYDMDPEFGEVEITIPFDSVLEVRAMSAISFNNTFSKVIIEYSQFIPAFNCNGGPRIHIFVWSKYQPIKVSWDSTIFLNEQCLRGSFLSNHQEDEVTGPFDLDEFPPLCACMAAQSVQYFELSEEALPPENSIISIDEEVEGLGIQTIYGLRFKSHRIPDYTPCYWITTDTDEPVIPTAPLAIFPNPSSGAIHIAGAAATAFEQLRVFDAMGKWVRELGVNHGEADLSGLPAGIYQLQAQGEDGKRYAGRVVKL